MRILATVALLTLLSAAQWAFARDDRKDALDDVRAASKDVEADKAERAKRAAERAAEELANPQMYWLDLAYRPPNGGRLYEPREYFLLSSKAKASAVQYDLPAIAGLERCEASRKYWLTMSGTVEKADCRPTAITIKMEHDRQDFCVFGGPRPQSPVCLIVLDKMAEILRRELKAK
jgi:hypothetical protein